MKVIAKSSSQGRKLMHLNKCDHFRATGIHVELGEQSRDSRLDLLSPSNLFDPGNLPDFEVYQRPHSIIDNDNEPHVPVAPVLAPRPSPSGRQAGVTKSRVPPVPRRSGIDDVLLKAKRDRLLAKAIFVSGLPYNTFDKNRNPDMVKFLNSFDATYTPPSTERIRNELYDEWLRKGDDMVEDSLADILTHHHAANE